MSLEYSSLTTSELHRRTYKYDLWRGFFEGVLSSGIQTFALFIAIRYYNAGEGLKSLIAAAPFIGMILSLPLVHYTAGKGLKKSFCSAVPSALASVCLIIAAWIPSLEFYALMITISYICRSAAIPYLTSIYSDNYPHLKRGASFSKPLLLTVAISSLFGLAGSLLLEMNIIYFNWVFTVVGISALAKAWAISLMPSKVIEKTSHNHPFGNFEYVIKDREFGYVLFTWFIMGFANLWVLPLRVDYVASSTYGIEASPLIVALIITIIPETIRFLFIPFWARLFDHMNFIVLRMILNVLFGMGIALFFISKNLLIIGAGSALIGLAFAGGSIAWALWVTKYAPPEKVSAYMSVHVCLTGIRGTIGPMIGYWTAAQVGATMTGWISCGLMILATIMLLPEIKHGRKKMLGAP
ncbi:MAG TPA: MFS transporter [Nitrospinaceae bacterium]|jgi:MFS family permease|nr:MFS transporter [Nitrospinaceae bacterium]HIN88297.1 MFS transporter [Nitrospinaceae bacterium]HIO23004.1 MFS transporter [Nitrospinaceae bacterium]|tara:strand:+ start:2558 stop:3787 length:1230 start_codon:yes stop_codon:yes gene_type:complete